MTRQSVQLQSSALSAADYDDEAETLEITFTSGQTYTFNAVPQKVFEDLRDSGSPGSYYHRHIKGRF